MRNDHAYMSLVFGLILLFCALIGFNTANHIFASGRTGEADSTAFFAAMTLLAALFFSLRGAYHIALNKVR